VVAQGSAAGSPPRDRARELVALTRKAAQAYGRPDLDARLAATARRLAEPDVRVLVVGEYKQGKSSLVNACINIAVCPVDDDIATSVPTAVHYAEQPFAVAVRASPVEGGEPEREPIPLDQLAAHVSESGNPENERRLLAVEVGVASRLLATGLVLEDTPGVGGLASAHSVATYAALPSADAVLFVTDAARELSAPELEFLHAARATCPNVLCALTKVDFYPEWRRILELDLGHLSRAGLEAPMFPVSTPLRLRALRLGDAGLNDESGYPALLGHLRAEVVDGADRLVARAAAQDQLSVIGQLETTFASERAVLARPEEAAALVGALDEAKARAAKLRGESARWQQTLNDGMADLMAEVDYDLRGRIRGLSQEADEALEQTDPGETWEQFQEWFQGRVASEISENYLMLAREAEALAGRVAEHFASAEGEVQLSLEVAGPDATLGALRLSGKVDAARRRVGGSALTVLRGSYSGTSLLSMLGGMAGFAVLSPLSAAVGLLMGGKALRDERQRHLTTRRQQARAAHRKYTEELGFQIGKHSRDTLRKVQRELRDRFASLAEELQRSTSEALSAAQGALQRDQSGREARLAVLDTELRRLAGLRERVQALGPDLAAPGGWP
jgi:Dynamin family